MSEILDMIQKIVKENKFCYAKEGGQGYVNKSKCTCTKENPCQAIVNRDRHKDNIVLRVEKLDDPMYKEVKYYASGRQEYIRR